MSNDGKPDAEKVKRTTEHVRKEIKPGRLKATKFGRDWMVTEEDFDKWQKRRGLHR